MRVLLFYSLKCLGHIKATKSHLKFTQHEVRDRTLPAARYCEAGLKAVALCSEGVQTALSQALSDQDRRRLEKILNI